MTSVVPPFRRKRYADIYNQHPPPPSKKEIVLEGRNYNLLNRISSQRQISLNVTPKSRILMAKVDVKFLTQYVSYFPAL